MSAPAPRRSARLAAKAPAKVAATKPSIADELAAAARAAEEVKRQTKLIDAAAKIEAELDYLVVDMKPLAKLAPRVYDAIIGVMYTWDAAIGYSSDPLKLPAIFKTMPYLMDSSAEKLAKLEEQIRTAKSFKCSPDPVLEIFEQTYAVLKLMIDTFILDK